MYHSVSKVSLVMEYLIMFGLYYGIALYLSISASIATTILHGVKDSKVMCIIVIVGCTIWPLPIAIAILIYIGYSIFIFTFTYFKKCTADSDIEQLSPDTASIAIDITPLQTQYQVQFIGQKTNQRIYEEDICCICHGQLCYNIMTSQSRQISRQGAACDRVCDVIQPDDCCLLSCGHIHHAECLIEWLRIKQQCPQCKTAQLLTNCKLVRSRREEIQIAAVH